MIRLSSPARRAWIRIAYLLPALVALLLLIYACIPHLFFLFEGEAHETLNLFTLMSNTWDEGRALIKGATDGSGNALMFSYIMTCGVIVSWVAIVLYTLVTGPAAVCSCYAFSKEPTSRESNLAKRWLRFFCPNRILFVLTNLLPIFPSLFPYLLLANYRAYWNYDIKLFYIGPPAWVLVVLLLLLGILPFLLLLPAQASEHLDMFRLYKAKSETLDSKA